MNYETVLQAAREEYKYYRRDDNYTEEDMREDLHEAGASVLDNVDNDGLLELLQELDLFDAIRSVLADYIFVELWAREHKGD